MVPHCKTSGRATEPKCKLMLAKSPESTHKKLELTIAVFFELSSDHQVVTYIRTYVCTELHYIPGLTYQWVAG